MGKIRIGIVGYGNIGRGVEQSIKRNDDMELKAVFTRRDPASVKIQTEGAEVKHFDDMEAIPEEVRDRYAGLIWLQPEGGDMMHSWKNATTLVAADDRLRVGVQLHKVMEVK